MGLRLVCLDDARRCGSLNARASWDRLCLLGVLHIMGWEGILTVVTLLSVLSTLMFTRYQADLVLVAAMAFLLVIGVLTPAHAFAGFANPGVITIATL